MKKYVFLLLTVLFVSTAASGSPWAEGDKTYGQKTGGKFVFGLKNLLLGWTAIPTETVKYQYYMEKRKAWEGFCYGIAKSVIYTGTGAIHLVTFPIPVDFPDMGEGVLETSVKEQAEREQGKKLLVAVPAETASVEAETAGEPAGAA